MCNGKARLCGTDIHTIIRKFANRKKYETDSPREIGQEEVKEKQKKRRDRGGLRKLGHSRSKLSTQPHSI